MTGMGSNEEQGDLQAYMVDSSTYNTYNTPPLHSAQQMRTQQKDNNKDDDNKTNKQEQEQDLPAPVAKVTVLISNKHTQQDNTYLVLLDTGANQCLATEEALMRAGIASYEKE